MRLHPDIVIGQISNAHLAPYNPGANLVVALLAPVNGH
jgi:hypothetical protein